MVPFSGYLQSFYPLQWNIQDIEIQLVLFLVENESPAENSKYSNQTNFVFYPLVQFNKRNTRR